MKKIAFAGFRHPHIFTFYQLVLDNPDVEIVAAFEENEDARKAAVEKAGVNFNCESYEELLNRADVDIVAIGDYYGKRGQMAIAALKAGKHMYSDKPLCTSLEELDEIEKLSKETGLKVGCMLDVRYHSWVEPVKEFIASGKIGEVHNMSFGGQHPLMYGTRAGWYFEEGKHGGTINDIAIHGIDLLQYITGLSVKRIVGARTWNAYAKEVSYFDDCGQFMLEMSNGAGLMADVSYAAPNSCGYNLPYYWRFNIWGTKGVLEFSYNDKNFYAAIDGTDGVEKIELPEVDTGDCLKEFIKELDGSFSKIDTAWTIKVTRDALSIQKAADNSVKKA